jgi:catechol 1,2-dioxygenase
MNLRGRFLTDAKGEIKFRSIKPIGYPIPLDGPVGDLVRVLGRHNMRPAHIHFLINKQGYKTQFSQVYSDDDPNIDTDVQFGVTEALTAHYTLHHAVDAPTKDIVGDWYSMSFKFFLEKGVNQLPKPPISSKTTGGRPELVVLTRRK